MFRPFAACCWVLGASLLTPLAFAKPATLHTPDDPALINHERIAYWLKARGELAKDATPEQIRQAVASYLGESDISLMNARRKAPTQYLTRYSSGMSKSQVKAAKAVAASDGSGLGDVNILAIAIDFQDLFYNDNGLSPSDTDMYYPSYPISHYQGLLFNQDSFPGPDGNPLPSARSYYQAVSGGTLNFTGNVYGWVRADQNAAYYGEKTAEERDIRAGELIQEAVTKAVQQFNIDLSQFDSKDYFDIDQDGNINEPDGIIDHIMVFHSSIGQEAGGGQLGDDAIWSHRFFVFDDNNQPLPVPGTSFRMYNYTITSIDASIGVVVHEFGHELNLDDEYDLEGSSVGEPVANWSLMSSGSYTGEITGATPVGFSPLAKDLLQEEFGGHWVNQQVIAHSDLNEQPQRFNLVHAVDNTSLNQLKVQLPQQPIAFFAPIQGQFQYYSQQGDNLSNSASRVLTIPQGSDVTLLVDAHWRIEQDYDYAQIKFNGNALAANHTQTQNPYYNNLGPYITGSSAAISSSSGAAGWVTLSLDVSSLAGSTGTLSLEYVTDTAISERGIAFDNLRFQVDGNTQLADDAETAGSMNLNGFLRIENTYPGKPTHYYVELRSWDGFDDGLRTTFYSPGVMMWYANPNFTDNNIDTHPGEGFILAIDADQRVLRNGASIASSRVQVRDAAFSTEAQTQGFGDTERSPIAEFDDSKSYQLSQQPESGVKLPKLGIKMTVESIGSGTRSATVALTRNATPMIMAEPQGLTVTFRLNGRSVQSGERIEWAFGDGNTSDQESPTHTYAEAGNYAVTATIYDGLFVADSYDFSVSVSDGPSAATITATGQGATRTFSADVSGGTAPYSYVWDFGDGNTSTESSPSHTYALSGNYTVSVTVTDADNKSGQFEQSFNIAVPLTVGYSVANNSGLTASFTSNVSGGDGNYTYSWDFGDGTTSSQANPSKTFSAAGAFNVRLTVIDGDDESASTVRTVTVTATPPPVNNGDSGGDSGGGSLWWLLSLVGLATWRRNRV